MHVLPVLLFFFPLKLMLKYPPSLQEKALHTDVFHVGKVQC